MVVVAVPVFVYGLTTQHVNGDEWIALVSVLLLLAGLYLVFRNITRKGILYHFIKRFFPSVEVYIDDIDNGLIKRKQPVSYTHLSITSTWSLGSISSSTSAACSSSRLLNTVVRLLRPISSIISARSEG